MARGDLTDAQWERLEKELPGNDRPGHPWSDHRKVINGILWVLRTGAPWRDLPERYGPWQTCYDRFVRWRKDGTWERILQSVQADADERSGVVWEGCVVDSSIVKAHPHAAGARKQTGKGGATKRALPLKPRRRTPPGRTLRRRSASGGARAD